MVKDYRNGGIGQSPEMNAIDERAAERELIKRIQDALGTGETGDNLVQVARNAHTAEMRAAHALREAEQYEDITDNGQGNFAMSIASILRGR